MQKTLLASSFISLLIITQSLFASTTTLEKSLTQEKYNARWLRYEEESKSSSMATMLNLVAPPFGHAYAGDTLRGIPFLLGDLIGLGLILSGTNTYTMTNKTASGESTATYTDINMNLPLGLCILGISHLWGMADASQAAEDQNQKLRQQLKISEQEYRAHYEIED